MINQAVQDNVGSIALNNGISIPQVGFGVFRVPPAETQRVVEDALEAGYRHIDTAAGYKNEEGVGAALRATGIPREAVFVATKLRNGEQADPRAAFDNSRKALGLDVIDLYLIHWPVPSQGLYVKAWKELERLNVEGAARAIGVSNFLPEHLDELVTAADIIPAVNQFELHPTLQQKAVAAKGLQHGIATEAYSPLGQGVDLLAGPVQTAAAAHNASPAQVILAWHIAEGRIVIPKTGNPDRMTENLAATAVQLTTEEHAAINALDCGMRIGAHPAEASFSQL